MTQSKTNGDGFWPEEVLVGEVVYPPGGKFGPRTQFYLQLVMIHSGSVRVEIDGVRHEAGANTVFVLFPGHRETFAFAEDGETCHSWLHVSPRGVSDEVWTRLARLEWPLPLSNSMVQLIHEALHMQRTPFPTGRELLKALGVQMIWRYIGEGEVRLTRSEQVTHAAVEQAQQFMLAHLGEPITLDMIAGEVAMSPAHLIRLFQAQLHISPMAYLWQRRVAKGIELLEQTGLSVGTIAQRCGFQSRFHFSRRVREAVGMTPLEVRRRSWQQV